MSTDPTMPKPTALWELDRAEHDVPNASFSGLLLNRCACYRNGHPRAFNVFVSLFLSKLSTDEGIAWTLNLMASSVSPRPKLETFEAVRIAAEFGLTCAKADVRADELREVRIWFRWKDGNWRAFT